MKTRHQITLTVLMLISAGLAVYSMSTWHNKVAAIMACFAFVSFWVCLWFVTATEMPEDFEQDEDLPKPAPTTIAGWLNTLPEPYRTQALENMDEDGGDCEADNAVQAVNRAFWWGSSPEGYDYWNNFHQTL